MLRIRLGVAGTSPAMTSKGGAERDCLTPRPLIDALASESGRGDRAA
jgi:hypothetical protein